MCSSRITIPNITMNHNNKILIFFAFLVIQTFFIEKSFALNLNILKEPQIVYLGPEVYYLKRTKEGGSKQDGWMFGGRVLYERRKSCGFYWAVNGLYAYGNINGKTSSGRILKSTLTEAEIEGRLGYTFCFKFCSSFSFTPYGGYGRYYCKNDFKHPSPLTCTYRDSFDYGIGGFIATKRFNPNFETSLDFSFKQMFTGKSSISHDPEYGHVCLKIRNEIQYEVAVPVIYTTCWKNRVLKLYAAPFYRYRHFGGLLNFPFDFIDTEFRSYGLRFMVYLSY